MYNGVKGAMERFVMTLKNTNIPCVNKTRVFQSEDQFLKERDSVREGVSFLADIKIS